MLGQMQDRCRIGIAVTTNKAQAEALTGMPLASAAGMTLSISALPVIDLADFHGGSGDTGARRAQLARAMDQACRDIGFIVVKGHGVPPAVLQGAFEAAYQFFDAPEACKRSAMPADGRVRGYTPMRGQQLARSLRNETPPDLFERFRMGPFDLPDDAYHASRAAGWFAPNAWPEGLSGFRPALQAYYRAMEALAQDLMRLFALALDLPPGWFEPHIDRHISSLCLNHYPALSVPPEPGQLRAGEHTDYGSLTIVAPSAAPGRLQVRTREGSWFEVQPPPGHFVVNIGDLMAQWTNDRWVSTLHRVGNPPADAAGQARRMSLVFFPQPNDNSPV
jgi:isopenicillin N synthase-like dioxygenase